MFQAVCIHTSVSHMTVLQMIRVYCAFEIPLKFYMCFDIQDCCLSNLGRCLLGMTQNGHKGWLVKF